MLYELRMYNIHEGRMNDLQNRLIGMPPLFEKHGFPTPLGQWSVTAGEGMPLYVWMLGWKDLEQRTKCFGSLYVDPAWHRYRDDTNGPREMLKSYNLIFMQGTPTLEAIRAQAKGAGKEPADSVQELRLMRAIPGRTVQFHSAMVEAELPAVTRAGGRMLGAFDVMSGFPGPAVMQFISWPDGTARDEGTLALGNDEDLRARAKADADPNGHETAWVEKSWLLRPTSYGCPTQGFPG